MPSPTWRREKSENVVQVLCELLTIDSLSQEIKSGIEAALWDTLKLLAESVEDGLDNKKPRWSPALVKIFQKEPERCNEWLKLMYEPNFSAEDYWK